MNFKNTILLTGAGFTVNFGGFLGREMWSKIFNYPKLNQAGKIKLDLHDNYNSFDFEKIYSDVLDNTSKYPDGEKLIYKEAVVEAYKDMNDYITRPDADKTISANQANVLEFLEPFLKRDGDKIGGFFTLNQDMFPEVKYNWVPFGPEVSDVIRPNIIATLPDQNTIDEFEGSISKDINFCYAKLHGAVNWMDAGGSEAMIVGINKPELIDKQPLLKWYFHLFHDAINKVETNLLVIGYSFRDKHINERLYQAVVDHKLSLYVISPEDPIEFKKKLTLKGYGEPEFFNAYVYDSDNEGIEIWRAVKAYFPYKLSDIFPLSGKRTAALDEILKVLA